MNTCLEDRKLFFFSHDDKCWKSLVLRNTKYNKECSLGAAPCGGFSVRGTVTRFCFER